MWNNAFDRLSDVGKIDVDNKLSKFSEKFDIMQTNGRDIPHYQRSRLSRIFNTSLLFSGLTVGEDYLANVTALAVARNFKVKNKNGKIETLWDAYDVEYTDKVNKTGAYLKLKDGYTKLDGSPITAEDESKYAKEVIGLNFELQGTYNLDDRAAGQQYAVGALLIMYRKWIAPAMKRRYQGIFNGWAAYSTLKGDFEEGYYTTLFRLLTDPFFDKKEVSEEKSQAMIGRMIDEVKAYMTSVKLNWENLSAYEKSNVSRAFTEMSIVLGLFGCALLLTKLPPDKDRDNDFLNWGENFLFVNILRLRTELGSMSPSPMMIDEALRILNSPFAALGPIRDSLKIFQLAVPKNYVEEIKTGRYRGHKKAYKYFRELPFISMFKKIDNFVDPPPLIQYYKNEVW